MALTINTNIKNDADGYLIDAKNVKGTYVVVEQYEDLANLPSACLVEGTLVYVQSDTNYDLNSSLYRYKGNADWEKVNFGSDVITKSLGLINPDEPTTFTVTSEELPYSFLTSDAPECFLIGLALGNSNNMFGIYFTNYAVNTNRYGVPSTIQYTTLFYFNDTQYLVVLTIDTTTPLQENNATLSFQELQAGSGGGGSGSQEITIEQNIRVISLNSLYPAPVTVLITQDNLDAFFAAMSSVAGTTINEDNFATIWASLNTTSRAQALGVLLTMYKHSVDYDGQPVLKFDSNDLSLYVAEVGSAISGATPNEYELNCIKVDTDGLTNATVTIAPLQTITISGGSGGTGSSRTLYHIEVADSNNHKAIIPIYKETFDKYLVEMNQVGQTMATAMSITWETLETIDDVKDYFDTIKSTQLAYGCDLAMNLLVKYAYESGENPVLRYISSSRESDIVVNQLLNYNLSTLQQPLSFPLGAVISFDYDPESIQVPDTTVGKTQNYYWFKPAIGGDCSITIDSNATFTYTAEEIAGGGSSGEGGSVELKSNVYTLKFSSNNTYEYTDSNEETQTTELPMIWGITFEAKDIVNRFNAIIDEFNSTSGASIAHITSENEIATTIKQIITMMIAGNMNNIQFASLFGNMLVYLANGAEQTSDEIYANSLNKLYRMFGTTCGYQDTPDSPLDANFLANVPITIIYGMLGGSIDFDDTARKLVQLDIENTGDYTKFCLKDTYELELINETPFEVSGSGSGSSEPVSGGSGKLYKIDLELNKLDGSGNEATWYFGKSSNEQLLNYGTSLKIQINIYESNFEKIKVFLNERLTAAGITSFSITDINSLVSGINQILAEEEGSYSNVAYIFLSYLLTFADASYINYDWSVNDTTVKTYSEIIKGTGTNPLTFAMILSITNDDSTLRTFLVENDETDPENPIYDRPYGLNCNNSATLTEYGTSGSGSGGTTQTKTIYEFTLKTSTDGNAIGTDNYNEMYVEISEEGYQAYLTELNALGRTLNPNWQDIHTADEAVAFIQQSLQNLPGSLVPLITSLSLLVDYSLKENRNPYANLYYTIGGNYAPYTSYAIAIATTSLNSTSPQVIGGSYDNNSTLWFDIDDMYPKTMLQLSSNSTASYTTRQESAGSGSGGGETATKKWYKFVFKEAFDETITIGSDAVQSCKLSIKINEAQFNELCQSLSQGGLTVSTPQDFMDGYEQAKGTQGATGLIYLIVSELVKYAMENQSQCELAFALSDSLSSAGEGDGSVFYPSRNINGFGGKIATSIGGTEYNWLDYITGSANSSLTVTEETETISGGSSTPSEPTLPERFSIAQNLVVNMNGQQYKPNQASWSGSNNDNIRQFKVGSSVATLTDIQALLSHLTGNPTYDVYNATKPTPCFVFCTESNICWKLQYDGETNGLRAYKVVNFPFVVKENRYYWHIMSSNDNRLTFWMNESAMQYLINAINTLMPTANPSWVNITDYNGVADLFNTLKVNASDPATFVLITTLLGSGGYVIKDHTSYGEKTPIYFTKNDNGYAEIREVTGVRVESSSNMMTYVDPFGVLGNSIITNDSSQASDGIYIDSNTALIISKQR